VKFHFTCVTFVFWRHSDMACTVFHVPETHIMYFILYILRAVGGGGVC
jgi:hypothetical protein